MGGEERAAWPVSLAELEATSDVIGSSASSPPGAGGCVKRHRELDRRRRGDPDAGVHAGAAAGWAAGAALRSPARRFSRSR